MRSSCPDLIRASIHIRNKPWCEDGPPGRLARRRAARFRPVMTIMMGATTQSSNDGIKTGAPSLPYSQLSYLAESKQGHPPELLVKDRCAGDRRLGALARRSFFGSPSGAYSARLMPKQ